MGSQVTAQKYSFSFWMGDAQGDFAHWDIRHEIGRDSPRDAEDVIGRILPQMSFVTYVSDFFKRCPCKITLIGDEDAMKIPNIKGVIKAYEKVLDCRERMEEFKKDEQKEPLMTIKDSYREAVKALEAIEDPKLIVETLSMW